MRLLSLFVWRFWGHGMPGMGRFGFVLLQIVLNRQHVVWWFLTQQDMTNHTKSAAAKNKQGPDWQQVCNDQQAPSTPRETVALSSWFIGWEQGRAL